MMNQADAKQDGDELSPALELLHITALKTNELRNNEDSAQYVQEVFRFFNIFFFRLTDQEQQAMCQQTDRINAGKLMLLESEYQAMKPYLHLMQWQAEKYIAAWGALNVVRYAEPPPGFDYVLGFMQMTTEEFVSQETNKRKYCSKAQELLESLTLRLDFDLKNATRMKKRRLTANPSIAIGINMAKKKKVKLEDDQHCPVHFGKLDSIQSQHKLTIDRDENVYLPYFNIRLWKPAPKLVKNHGQNFYVPLPGLISTADCFDKLLKFYRHLPNRTAREIYHMVRHNTEARIQLVANGKIFNEPRADHDPADHYSCCKLPVYQVKRNSGLLPLKDDQLMPVYNASEESKSKANDDIPEQLVDNIEPEDLAKVFESASWISDWKWTNNSESQLAKTLCQSLGGYFILSVEAIKQVLNMCIEDDFNDLCETLILISPDEHVPFVPCYRRGIVHMLEMQVQFKCDDAKIINELIQSPIQLEMELSKSKYGNRPFIIMKDDQNRWRSYAMRFDFVNGWEITDDASQEYFQLRNQPHFHRILSGAIQVFIIAWRNCISTPVDSSIKYNQIISSAGVGFKFTQLQEFKMDLTKKIKKSQVEISGRRSRSRSKDK